MSKPKARHLLYLGQSIKTNRGAGTIIGRAKQGREATAVLIELDIFDCILGHKMIVCCPLEEIQKAEPMIGDVIPIVLWNKPKDEPFYKRRKQ